MNNKFQKSSGFSTVELLVAMALLILCLTGVLLVSSGSESLLVGSQTSREALGLAQEELEEAQSLARKDFQLVIPKSRNVTLDGLTYHVETNVATLADYVTKQVDVKVTYQGLYNKIGMETLSGLVTNFNIAKGYDTCDSTLTPNAEVWKLPHIKNATQSFSALVGVSGTYPITDMDAYLGKLYVTTNNSSVSQNNFFVFSLGSPESPALIGSLDNDLTTNTGLNAVVTDGAYAYVANGGSPLTVGQLQVINLSTMTVVRSVKASGVSGITGLQGVGNSVFYKDGYVYLGLKSTGGHGPEFHIFDVHSSESPVEVGSFAVGNDVNAIYVTGKYAYIATPNSQELLVLDVGNPGGIKFGTPAWGYDAGGSSGNGKSLQVVGDTLYLGRTNPSSGPEVYALDVTNPEAIPGLNSSPKTISVLSSVDALHLQTGFDLASIRSARSIIFLLTRTAFGGYDLIDYLPWTPTKLQSEFLQLPKNGSAVYEPVMDCEGNYFFVGSNDASNNGYLYVIAP